MIQLLLASTLLLPIVLAAVIALAGALPTGTADSQALHRIRRSAGILAPLSVLPAIALCLVAGDGSLRASQLEVPWLLFGAVFGLDTAGRALLLIAALLYGSALMAISWAKLRDTERGSGALSGYLLVCFTGNAGTYLAADAVSFYLFFTLMSFSAAGLVIHYRTRAAYRATRIYLVMSVLSETAILAALILTVAAGGHQLVEVPAAVSASAHTGLITGLLLFGFGVKAGTVPLHVWLPLAHPAAPPAASAVLSGAMVKAGLIGWLRFLPEAGHSGAGWILLVLALLGAFAAVAVGVLQRDPKVVLAYSTISQMGFIACLVAVGLILPELRSTTTTAAVLYAVHHGLAKGALFLGVPVAKHFGHGATGWLVVAGLAGAGLAVAGAPLTSGAFGKYVSKEAVEPVSVAGVGLDHLLPLVATGSTLLLLRFAQVMMRAQRDADAVESQAADHQAARPRPAGELASWLLMCTAGIAVPWVIGMRWFGEHFSWEASALWDASWPILLGLALAVAVWPLARRIPRALTVAVQARVQPGDLIVAEESAAMRGMRAGAAVLARVHDSAGSVRGRAAETARASAAQSRQRVSGVETRLEAWEGSGVAVLVLLILVTGAVILALGGGR